MRQCSCHPFILFTSGQSLIEAADARLMGADGTMRNLIDLTASTKVNRTCFTGVRLGLGRFWVGNADRSLHFPLICD